MGKSNRLQKVNWKPNNQLSPFFFGLLKVLKPVTSSSAELPVVLLGKQRSAMNNFTSFSYVQREKVKLFLCKKVI